MFGYLSADTGLLTEEQYNRYRAAYCGLCRSLREQFGQPAGLTLNYDMTFLVLLLQSLYEPEETTGEGGCVIHPMEKRLWQRSDISDYAAAMNLALSYYKCLDNWQDDGDVASLAAAKLLEGKFAAVRGLYPRQCAAMAGAIEGLRLIERQNTDGADPGAAVFGTLMGELFVLREDRWEPVLRAMGSALGGFIYIMDACMDLDGDTLRGRYNPFRRYYGLENQRRFRDMLKMLLGECLFWFDRLPLVQDVGILQNILCSGLWAQFDKKYSDKKDTSDDSGSVQDPRRLSRCER